MRSSFQVEKRILLREVGYLFWAASDNNSRQICKQAIIKLSLDYTFRKFSNGQNLKHVHMTYFFLELLIFFWLTLADVYCLEFISYYIKDGDYMSRLAGMKFCLILPGSRQCYKFFINYTLGLHIKSFIPGKQDPCFLLPRSHFSWTKFSHVISSTRQSGMKKLINTSVWKNI